EVRMRAARWPGVYRSGATDGIGGGRLWTIGWPQPLQNRAVALTATPHAGHTVSRRAPHSSQKRAPPRPSRPQSPHPLGGATVNGTAGAVKAGPVGLTLSRGPWHHHPSRSARARPPRGEGSPMTDDRNGREAGGPSGQQVLFPTATVLQRTLLTSVTRVEIG